MAAACIVQAALAGCASTGEELAIVPTVAEVAYPALPDTMSLLPSPRPDRPADAAVVTVGPAAPDPTASSVVTALAAFPAAPPPPADGTAAISSDAALAGLAPVAKPAPPFPAVAAPTSGNGTIDGLIQKYAALYEVPVDLVRRVVKRESTFNPRAYNRGHWGLMQIKHATARGMGYDGPAQGLFDPETNLKYAVKYLRGAYLVAGGNHDFADRLYQTGYYYHAKRAGLLDETGLGRDRISRRGG